MNARTYPHLVMVYGTLQSGHNNNSVMAGGTGKEAELLGPAITMHKYFMASGGFPRVAKNVLGWPVGANRHDHLAQVRGEVWRVTNDSLKACDRLEGHPRFYCREQVPVVLLDEGRTRLRPWIYIIVDPLRGYECIEKNAAGVLEWKSPRWAA